MQCLKLAKFALVLALCAAAASAAEQPETSLSTRNAVNNFQNALNAMQKFVDIFNSKILEETPVGQVAEILSKILSTVISVINIIMGNSAENAIIKEMRHQFRLLHNRFDRIELQLQDIMDLIEWNTAKIIYAEYDKDIDDTHKLYMNYLNAEKDMKGTWRKKFIEFFEAHKFSAYRLYQGVFREDSSLAPSLADEVKKVSKNHRKKVMNFMLEMNRRILQGAQMEIAYYTLTGNAAAAKVITQIWANRMKIYVEKMKSVENSVKAAWRSQLTEDSNSIITRYSHLSNSDFAWKMYRFLAEKFDWQSWIVAAYYKVKGTDNHLIGHVMGALFFRVAGNRNVVIGRTYPKTSTWSKAKADEALRKADATNFNSDHCERWYKDIINPLYPVNGRSVTLTMVVRYGKNLTVVSYPHRRSFRIMTDKYNRKRVIAIMFG